MTTRIGAAALLALLGGCAAWDLTEAECRGMNWYARGESDGRSGHPPQDIRLGQQCGRYGVAASETDYLKGWEVGHDEWDRLKTMKDD